MLYILLSGVPPFYGNTDADILDSVRKGVFTFDIPEFQGVSDLSKDLIKKMLTKPAQRINSQQVLEHKWMKADLKNAPNLKLNINSLKSFQNHEKLKKVALTYIASQMSEQEITELGNLFKSLDKNGDGVLTIDEITSGVNDMKDKTGKELQVLMNAIDTDGSGTINYTEFIAATMETSQYMKDEKLYMAFKMFDRDGSGKIDAKELKDILGSLFSVNLRR